MEEGGKQTIPLPRNLIPRIAKTPGIIIHRLPRVYEHILFARAAGIQTRDLTYDLLALGRHVKGGGGVGLVVHAGGGVVCGVGRGGQGLSVRAGLVLAEGDGGPHGARLWVKWKVRCEPGGKNVCGSVSIVDRIIASL